MKIKNPLGSVLAFCFFAFLATVAASERPVYGQCEGVTDAKITSDIIAKIKNDKSLSTQMRHINVSVTNAAVKLQGWTDTKKDYDRLVGFAAGTSCVRVVNVNDLQEAPPAANSNQRLGAGGGCASGTKPCGDICIPEGDSCNIP